MGFDVALVRSEPSHYHTFVCSVCHDVADLDALVTSKCSHPFCKSCLESWIPRSSSCPTCSMQIVGIKYGDKLPCPTCRQKEGEIYPLADSQPLAYASLSRIQVCCPHCRTWEGDYGDLPDHEDTCKYKISGSTHKSRGRFSKEDFVQEFTYQRQQFDEMEHGEEDKMRPLGLSRSPAAKSRFAEHGSRRHDPSEDTGGGFPELMGIEIVTKEDEQEPLGNNLANLSEDQFGSFNADDDGRGAAASSNLRGASNIMEESLSNPPDQGNNVEAVESTSRGTSSSSQQRSRSRKSPTRDAARLNNDDADNVRKSRDDAVEEPNESSASRNRRSRTSRHRSRELSSANQLKEKANAKFNKGDHVEARNLYSQALGYFHDYDKATPEEKQVIATLFCNRGATFFRDKDYEACVQDCENAVQLVPEYAKAYTRRWRALMAMGRVKSAKALLEGAIQILPREKALQEDLFKTRQILDVQTNVRRLYAKRNYVEAKGVVDNQMLFLTDNPEALLLAAEVDASNGLMEVGLERCETVLKAYANNTKALQTKGKITYLTGLMEPGMALLREAARLENDGGETKEVLRKCRNIHKEYMDGRSVAARGRASLSQPQLKLAMDMFSSILEDDSHFIPPKTPLYSLFLTERAEAALHSQLYQLALSDARGAIDAKEDNLRAWIVKGHAYIALGRAREARDELKQARRTTWGQYNVQLKEVYSKADFETRVNEQDQELRSMVAEGRTTSTDSPTRELNSSSHEVSRSSQETGRSIHDTSRVTNEAGRPGNRHRRRNSDDQSLGTNNSGSNNSGGGAAISGASGIGVGIGGVGRQRHRQSMSMKTADKDRQDLVYDTKKRIPESSGTGPPGDREDVLRQIRRVGSGKDGLPTGGSRQATQSRNRDDMLRQIRRRKSSEGGEAPPSETNSSHRHSRRDRQRRRESVSASSPARDEQGADPGRSQSRHRRRPIMSEADLRRRMSAI